MRDEAALSVQHLGAAFGGVTVLDGVSLDVQDGSIHSIIGPNGAGKTTLFNVISRLVPIQGGRVLVGGVDLGNVPPHEVARNGIARTFQNGGLCLQMSVLDNVLVGMHRHGKVGWVRAPVAMRLRRREEAAFRKRALALLERLGIAHVGSRLVEDLPFGVMKIVEIARALACEPRLLLLDEPAAGLTSSDANEFAQLARCLVGPEFGITVVIIEHNMAIVREISDMITVLDHGQKIGEGPPAVVLNDPLVLEAYLGTG